MSWNASDWEFDTERLRIRPWRSRGEELLAEFLLSSLTEAVTRELPPSWQDGPTAEDVADWIAERDREGEMFLVERTADAAPVGLFMFFPGEATSEGGEVRLGYVFAEAVWGQGLATELVQGFLLRWDEKLIKAELVAGVTAANTASRRVLEKSGFSRTSESTDLLKYKRGRS